MFKIAIIGRPNVGKSTLFNKLVGKKFAITDDTPGVTRDRKEAPASLADLEFVAIDTAGLEHRINDQSLEKRMVEQTELAVDDADLCLFVVDAKAGVVIEDEHFARWLRRINKKTILIANKCENFDEAIFDNEYYKLGFGKPVAISAEHKLGFGDLYEAISPDIEEYQKNFSEINDDSEKSDLQIAIVGRPNAGKSTLLNKILGYDRMITGPEAGITRDAIAVDFSYPDSSIKDDTNLEKIRKIRFIDTAGIRKRSNITQDLEKFSIQESFRAIRFAHVVILVIDANSTLDHQDMALAGEILREGRGLVFAINKIDEIKGDKEVFMKKIRTQIQDLFSEINGTAIVGISAKTGYNIDKCLNFALKTYDQWQSYISTSKLVEWLRIAVENHRPNLYKGREVKLKYATQIKKRPPTIAIFVNHIKPLEGSYQRYLSNHFREFFGLDLTPIRITFKKSENPFENNKEKKFSKRLSGDKRKRK